MSIRTATGKDSAEIRALYRATFPETEREQVAELAIGLLAQSSTPPTISLVAELEGRILGHVAFSPVTCRHDPKFLGFILAPLGVMPDEQKRGIGTKLVESGKEELLESGAQVVLVYGDPAYYGRFGFLPDALAAYRPPYDLEQPFGWQFLPLQERAANRPPIDLTCVAPLCDPQLW